MKHAAIAFCLIVVAVPFGAAEAQERETVSFDFSFDRSLNGVIHWTGGLHCHGDPVPESSCPVDMASGLDFAGKGEHRSFTVLAMESGTVTFKDEGGLGNQVAVRHVDGSVLVYGHLASFSDDYEEGERVERGQVIGVAGDTGKGADNVHLHIDLRDGGECTVSGKFCIQPGGVGGNPLSWDGRLIPSWQIFGYRVPANPDLVYNYDGIAIDRAFHPLDPVPYSGFFYADRNRSGEIVADRIATTRLPFGIRCPEAGYCETANSLPRIDGRPPFSPDGVEFAGNGWFALERDYQSGRAIAGAFESTNVRVGSYTEPSSTGGSAGRIPVADLLDIVFVIDTTGSMRDDIDAVKEDAIAIINDVASRGADWQIGLVTYRDHPVGPYGDPGDYVSRTELSFSSDSSAIVSAVNAIRVDGGGDERESVFSGLMEAVNFPWRVGARKAIILMGDAPPHDPEPFTGLTRDIVLQAAFDIDPASIYPIFIGAEQATRESFQAMADGSSGRLFRAETADSVVETVFETVSSIAHVPDLSRLLSVGSQARVSGRDIFRLNLRVDPGLNAPVLEELIAGEIVQIVGEPRYANTYIWWHVLAPSGQEGWAVEATRGSTTLVPINGERHIECAQAPVPQLGIGDSGRVVLDLNTAVRIRELPTTSAHVSGQFNHGEEFAVLNGPICNNGYLWYEVAQTGREGWIAEGAFDFYWVEPLLEPS